MGDSSLYTTKRLHKYVNQELAEKQMGEMDESAVGILKCASEEFVKEMIERSIKLKTTRRSASRNKSIRSDDVYTALYDLPQYSFLSTFIDLVSL